MKVIHSQPQTHGEFLSLMASHEGGFCGCIVDFDRDASRPSMVRDAASVMTSKPPADIRYDHSLDGGYFLAVNPLSKRASSTLGL